MWVGMNHIMSIRMFFCLYTQQAEEHYKEIYYIY